MFVEREDGRFIEVFDPDGPFVDAGRWDFTSTVVTNALDVVESMGKDRQAAAVRVFFAYDTAPSGIEVSNNGSTWDRLGKTGRWNADGMNCFPLPCGSAACSLASGFPGDRPLSF